MELRPFGTRGCPATRGYPQVQARAQRGEPLVGFTAAMPRPAQIPPALAGVPFRGSEAVAGGLVTRYQLRSQAWCRLLHGAYVTRELATDPAVRLQALHLVMPAGAVIAGRTAAWLHGVWEPRPGHAVPLELARSVRAPAIFADGVVVRRLVLRGGPDLRRPLTGLSSLDRDVVEVDGIRVTSSMRTCFDLMRERALVEAVVVADAFAAADPPLPLPHLDAYCADRRRWPNVRLARQAVDLARSGVRSPGESRLRMILVLSGLADPLVNVPILRRGTDEVLGVPDLTMLGPRRMVGVEYDGGYHDDADQPALDRRRDNRLTVSSLPILRYDNVSVTLQRTLVAEEVAQACGDRITLPLCERDFRRPPPRLAW